MQQLNAEHERNETPPQIATWHCRAGALLGKAIVLPRPAPLQNLMSDAVSLHCSAPLSL